jgi:hypothetical protein
LFVLDPIDPPIVQPAINVPNDNIQNDDATNYIPNDLPGG